MPTLFHFRDRTIRVFQDQKGQPWFVGKDVCDALELPTRHGTYEHLASLPETERWTITRENLTPIVGRVTASVVIGKSGIQVAISENGILNLVERVNTKNARLFYNFILTL